MGNAPDAELLERIILSEREQAINHYDRAVRAYGPDSPQAREDRMLLELEDEIDELATDEEVAIAIIDDERPSAHMSPHMPPGEGTS